MRSFFLNQFLFLFRSLGSNVEVLMSGNVRCYNVVVEMMKSFPDSETVQEVSCCLLHKLTLGKFTKLFVVSLL